jgi:hypothetical protein
MRRNTRNCKKTIEGLLDDLDEVIEKSDLDITPAALEYDWSELPDSKFSGSANYNKRG